MKIKKEIHMVYYIQRNLKVQKNIQMIKEIHIKIKNSNKNIILIKNMHIIKSNVIKYHQNKFWIKETHIKIKSTTKNNIIKNNLKIKIQNIIKINLFLHLYLLISNNMISLMIIINLKNQYIINIKNQYIIIIKSQYITNIQIMIKMFSIILLIIIKKESKS